MNARTLLTAVALSILPAPAAPVIAVAPATQDDAAAVEPELEFLQRSFENLFRSLQVRGGFAEKDRAVMESLRERVAAFTKRSGARSVAIAIELQLTIWLDDDDDRVSGLFEKLVEQEPEEERYRTAWAGYFRSKDDQKRVEKIYRRLFELFPDDAGIRISRAQLLRDRNRFEEAMELLENADIDLTANPAAALIMSDCLFSQHRFEDAADVLEGVTDDAKNAEPTLSIQIQSQLTARRGYVELWAAEQVIRQTEAEADDLPRVEIYTERGRIRLELFENEAPNTVANFIKLVSDGFYDGTTFHRVLGNFMAQGGDPFSKEGATGTPGNGDPGYKIRDEHTLENARNHFTGSLAMAKRTTPDTAGCQFYITLTPPAHLNGRHTVFGRVFVGQDVVRAIEQEDRIETIQVLRKRDHEYEPETISPPGVATTAPSSENSLDADLSDPLGQVSNDNDDQDG